MNKPEILIIDDEPQIRKLLEIALESNDYKVWQAETGSEGIRMAANILSVQNSEADIVNALDSGATDYLTKPFRTAELLARIRASIRRNQLENTNTVIECGDLQINLVARTVKKNNEPLKLTSTEYNLLTLFAKNEGSVLTHQFILKEIWGTGFQTDTQYLRVFVGTLRKKIEDNPNQPKHIITESGVGYRFS